MKTITTRFGQIEYDPENLLHFPQAAKHPLQDTTSFRRYRTGG